MNDGDIEIIEPVPDSDEAINFASFSRPPLKPLVRADYPKVTYWHKHEWMSASKAMKADADDPNKKKGPQTNGNTTMMYVKDKDGNCINGHRAKEIRAVVTQFWLWLKKVNQLPRTWTQLDLKLSDLYRLEMAYRFPELQLCEGGCFRSVSIAQLPYNTTPSLAPSCKLYRLQQFVLKQSDRRVLT